MPYTESQLIYIREKRPELRLKAVPKLDEVIVKFLEKFEVFVKPATSSKRNVGSDVISGAITGMAGADVGGDAFLISGQNKQTAIQEWTQWKQWALGHKDFESFKFEMIDKAKQHNEDVKNKLEDPKVKKDLETLLREKKIEAEKEDKEFMKVMGIVVCTFIFLFIGYIGILHYQESKESSIPQSSIKSSSSDLGKLYLQSFKDLKLILESFK